MHIILFIFYAALLGWIFVRRPFFSELRPAIVLTLFALRIIAGCFHTWIAWNFYPDHGDIWMFFKNSFIARNLLFHDLHAFYIDNHELPSLAHNIIQWTHMAFNCLSFGNLYINTLFFCALTFGGNIALFKVIYHRFGKNMLSAAAMVLLPSVLFWTTCMHSEGVVYCLLGWLCYLLNRYFTERRQPAMPPTNHSSTARPLTESITSSTARTVFSAVLLTAAVLLFRPALAIGLLPALIWWIASEKKLVWRTLGIITISLTVFALAAPGLLAKAPIYLANRQHEFLAMSGNSIIPLPSLQPTFKGLKDLLPTALLNGWLQPLPGRGGQKIYMAFSVELLGIWTIALFGVLQFMRTKTAPCVLQSCKPSHTSITITCLLLALPPMILIGYIVPFVGAIVRYRSICLPFLLAPAIAAFRHQRLFLKWNQQLTAAFFK